MHKVLTDVMGDTLLELTSSTQDKRVRTSVSDLESAWDASALEKYYHKACLRSAQRTVNQDERKRKHEQLVRCMCDEELLSVVETSVMDEGSSLDMYLSCFTRVSEASVTNEHYQLSGDVAMRTVTHALKPRHSMEKHCAGNPITENMPVKHLTSSALVPESAKDDMLHFAQKGQKQFEDFVQDRLLTTSTASVWDSMKKLKLKIFSNLAGKSRCLWDKRWSSCERSVNCLEDS